MQSSVFSVTDNITDCGNYEVFLITYLQDSLGCCTDASRDCRMLHFCRQTGMDLGFSGSGAAPYLNCQIDQRNYDADGTDNLPDSA